MVNDDDAARRREQVEEIRSALGGVIIAWSQLTVRLRTEITDSRVPGSFAIVADLDDRRLINAYDAVTKARLDFRHENGVQHTDENGNVTIDREFGDESDDQAIANTLRKWLHALHDERNRIQHDVWFVGWGNEETTDWSTAERLRMLAKATPEYDREDITAEKLRHFAAEIDHAAQVVWLFGSRRRFGPKWGIPGTWKIDKKKVWPPVEPPAPSS